MPVPLRPRVEKEERRRRFLTLAEQMFGERGYGNTEVEALARAAGVSKPILYRLFPRGKPDILAQLLDEYERRIVMALWGAISNTTDPRSRLHAGIDAYFRFIEEHPAGARLIEEAAADPDPVVREIVPEIRRTVAQGVTNTIADVMAAAGLDPKWSPAYAYAMVGATQAAGKWWLENPQVCREDIVDHLMAFFWQGFANLPRDPTRLRKQGSIQPTREESGGDKLAGPAGL